MTDEEKNFIKKVNVDKARNKIVAPIILIILSIFTYIIPIIFGAFDFGIIFEIISLIFLIIARNYMLKYDENKAKRYVICSMLSIGWILIYDAIIFIASIRDFIDLTFIFYDYIFSEILSLLYILCLFAINYDLSKADNPIKYKESTDWFYENYEEEKEKKSRN